MTGAYDGKDAAADCSDAVVSIVMPCRNSEAYLREAIESVLSQTMTQWELIAVDDASRDFSVALFNLFLSLL